MASERRVVVRRRGDSTLGTIFFRLFSVQFAEPSIEESPFRLLPGQGQTRWYETRASRFVPGVGMKSARAAWARWYSTNSPLARMASMTSRPVSGPSRMAIAAAQFNATIGDGSAAHQDIVQGHELRPVRLPGNTGAMACTAAMAAWIVVRPDLRAASARSTRGCPSSIRARFQSERS